MKLNIKDRLIIGSLLPKEANLLTQILVKEMLVKVTITKEEIEKYKIEQTGTQITWKDIPADIDIEFNEAEISILKKQITTLDQTNKITQDMLDICIKINNVK